MQPKKLVFQSGPADFLKASHYMFRYPAKFHPPVARWLIESFTNRGDVILDPFCGSGTIAVESKLLGRHSIGVDIDPVAIFVSQVKTRYINVQELESTCEILTAILGTIARHDSEYVQRSKRDISERTLRQVTKDEELWIPDIPNIGHWFRNYVQVDLARILQAIESLDAPKHHIDFLRLCFAASIRNSSNADPVPVSGLEVTAHMRRKDELGRIVNPFQNFSRFVDKNLRALAEFVLNSSRTIRARFIHADTSGPDSMSSIRADAVVTSPPYHSAVDYYRRHTLEMYWLRFTIDRADRLNLLGKYIGRPSVPASHPFVLDGKGLSPRTRSWEAKIRRVSGPRANSFKHYAVSMTKSFEELSHVLSKGAVAIFVVGHSGWGNEKISTSQLFEEIAEPWFDLVDRYWYPISNRYMSYTRHNGADISREHVLVFQKRH